MNCISVAGQIRITNYCLANREFEKFGQRTRHWEVIYRLCVQYAVNTHISCTEELKSTFAYSESTVHDLGELSPDAGEIR